MVAEGQVMELRKMVSAGMVLGRSIAMVAGRSGDGVAVDGECGDGSWKDNCHGCCRSGDGVAVDGEFGDGAGKEQNRGSWRSGEELP